VGLQKKEERRAGAPGNTLNMGKGRWMAPGHGTVRKNPMYSVIVPHEAEKDIRKSNFLCTTIVGRANEARQ
jgi:hypothetical protein